jgi:hypothetical protein
VALCGHCTHALAVHAALPGFAELLRVKYIYAPRTVEASSFCGALSDAAAHGCELSAGETAHRDGVAAVDVVVAAIAVTSEGRARDHNSRHRCDTDLVHLGTPKREEGK